MTGAQSEGRLPDFVVIGAMKAGTTSLHGMLSGHPDIFMSREKELHFFTEAANLPRGEGWYRSHFRTDRRLCGETSPSYAAWPRHKRVPERMRSLIPEARLIYCVRDPIERALSHYKHALATGVQRRPVDEGILHEAYLRQGRYHTQLQRYLGAGFPLERIHLVQSEDLRHRRREVVADVLRFLEVDPDRLEPVARRDWHVSDRKRVPTDRGLAVRRVAAPLTSRLPWSVRSYVEHALVRPLSRPMPKLILKPETRDALREAFADEAARLRALTGHPLAGWQV